jgi:hypothetical protein
MSSQSLLVTVFLIPVVCVLLVIAYQQLQGWRIYHRIGNYSIGLATFFMQLEYQGCNFPGPNVLEAQLANQPIDVQAQVQAYRRRIRYLRRGVLLYIGFLLLVLFLIRKLSS